MFMPSLRESQQDFFCHPGLRHPHFDATQHTEKETESVAPWQEKSDAPALAGSGQGIFFPREME
jgi:hypothetical protein